MCLGLGARLFASLAVALAVASLPYATVGAAEWRRLYSASDRSVDIDLDGLRQRDEVVLVWVRFSFVKEQRDSRQRSYRSMFQLWAYQCAAGRQALMQFAEYSDDRADKLVAADSRDRYDWSYPEPHTIGAAAMKSACSRAPGLNTNLTRKQPISSSSIRA